MTRTCFCPFAQPSSLMPCCQKRSTVSKKRPRYLSLLGFHGSELCRSLKIIDRSIHIAENDYRIRVVSSARSSLGSARNVAVVTWGPRELNSSLGMWRWSKPRSSAIHPNQHGFHRGQQYELSDCFGHPILAKKRLLLRARSWPA